MSMLLYLKQKKNKTVTLVLYIYIWQVCIKEISNIKHLKSGEYFFKVQKTIVKTGTPITPKHACKDKMQLSTHFSDVQKLPNC